MRNVKEHEHAPLHDDVLGAALARLGRGDERVQAVAAARPGRAWLTAFEREFPHRFRNVGIEERHVLGAAVGLAKDGMRPVVAIPSELFVRAFDRTDADVDLTGLPIVFCIDCAEGSDAAAGRTGVLDMVLLTRVPGMTVFAPSSAAELEEMLAFALTMDGPAIVRYPNAVAPRALTPEVDRRPKARRMRSGRHVCIIAGGRMLDEALDAAEGLEGRGVCTTVWDSREGLAPLDPAMIEDACQHLLVVAIENGICHGGLASEVASAVAAGCGYSHAPSVLPLGTRRSWLPQGRPAETRPRGSRLDGRSIETQVWEVFSRHRAARPTTSVALAW